MKSSIAHVFKQTKAHKNQTNQTKNNKKQIKNKKPTLVELVKISTKFCH